MDVSPMWIKGMHAGGSRRHNDILAASKHRKERDSAMPSLQWHDKLQTKDRASEQVRSLSFKPAQEETVLEPDGDARLGRSSSQRWREELRTPMNEVLSQRLID